MNSSVTESTNGPCNPAEREFANKTKLGARGAFQVAREQRIGDVPAMKSF